MLFGLKKFIRLARFFMQGGLIGRQILLILCLGLSLNLVFGSLFYWAEKAQQPDLSYLDAIWWAMVTMTTVGYGDISPITVLGRFVISYLCMLFGIGIIGYLVGVLAEHIIDTLSKIKKGHMNILEENHLILCNFPSESKVMDLIEELRLHPDNQKLVIVLISDEIDELPQSLQKSSIRFIKGNPSDEEVLLRANLLACQGVVILAKDDQGAVSDERNFAICSIIEMIEKEQNKPIKTVVEVVAKKNFKLMKRSNVDSMISSEGITSKMLAQEFINPGVHDVLQQVLSNAVGSQLYIQPTRLYGWTFLKLQQKILESSLELQVVGMIKGEKKILNPAKQTPIEDGDRLVVLAEDPKIFTRFEQESQA